MKHIVKIIFLGLVLIALFGTKLFGQNQSSLYFSGTGGKGMSLGILVPESRGLTEDQAYLPRMVQGALVSNFSKYSAISVLDRVSLDKVIAETLDPTYEDNFDIVRLGHVAQVGYMLTGNIMRTSIGYTMQINITDTTPGAKTIASYSGSHTVAELDNFSAINRASKELFEQIGIQLTAAAISGLNQASSARDINAQTNLAQGIVAQQKGTVVEALTYYYNAVSFDSQLSEANDRLSSLSSTVTSGNIGENVRNDIQRRNEWVKLLTEAEDYFFKHPPYELVYSNSLTQGKIDYSKETVILNTSVSINTSLSINALNNIIAGLEATGKRREWGFISWPFTREGKIFEANGEGGRKALNVITVLLNEKGTIISTSRGSYVISVSFPTIQGKRDNTKIYIHNAGHCNINLSFTVNANDITDNLTIKIISVNDVDVAQNPNYIRIVAE